MIVEVDSHRVIWTGGKVRDEVSCERGICVGFGDMQRQTEVQWDQTWMYRVDPCLEEGL